MTKENCKLPERTAQLYMELAEGRPTIEAKLAKFKGDNPATVAGLMSELSLRGALQLLKGGGEGKRSTGNGGTTKGPGNPFDAYDDLRVKLIKRLKALPPDDAEMVANKTIKELRTVADIRQIAKNAIAKSTKAAA